MKRSGKVLLWGSGVVGIAPEPQQGTVASGGEPAGTLRRHEIRAAILYLQSSAVTLSGQAVALLRLEA